MKETAYLLQAALLGAWWFGLAASPSFFHAFQFDDISPTAFWSFLLPDLAIIGFLSIVRAYRVDRSIESMVLGAFAYATLFCCSATWLTNSGYLPTGLMLFGLAYNLILWCPHSCFRASLTSSYRWNGLKTLLQIVCIWIVALVLIPYVLLSSFAISNGPITMEHLVVGMEPFRTNMSATGQSGTSDQWFDSTTTLFSVITFCLCSGLGLSSAYVMVRDGDGTPLPLDQTNRLVVTGPYRFIRNPMAVAGIGQGLAIALMFQSLPVFVYAVLGLIVWQLVIRPIEEEDLRIRFGDPYRDYCREVRCWWPRWRRSSRSLRVSSL